MMPSWAPSIGMNWGKIRNGNFLKKPIKSIHAGHIRYFTTRNLISEHMISKTEVQEKRHFCLLTSLSAPELEEVNCQENRTSASSESVACSYHRFFLAFWLVQVFLYWEEVALKVLVARWKFLGFLCLI